MVRGGKLKMKHQGPNKKKYSNQRREKTKITAREVITYIVQLLFLLLNFPSAI